MKTGRVVGLVFLGLAIAAVLLPLAGSILYLITGSLEKYPTPKQEEKARIAGTVATASFGVLETLLVGAFVAIAGAAGEQSGPEQASPQ